MLNIQLNVNIFVSVLWIKSRSLTGSGSFGFC